MSKLIITEKPSVAQGYAKVIILTFESHHSNAWEPSDTMSTPKKCSSLQKMILNIVVNWTIINKKVEFYKKGDYMISRPYYLDKIVKVKNNGFPKIITGIRRCGKSAT